MGFRSPLPHIGISGPISGPTQGFRSFFPFGLSSQSLPAGTKDASGNVQSQNATMAGIINRTTIRTISGAVQSDAPTMSGDVQRIQIELSGGVQAQDSTTAGTLTAYPLTGWSLTNFTVNHAGLDPDSPYTDPAYSSIVIGDKAHYETLTDPDGHTMTMNGLGEYTISPSALLGPQTFDHQVYDESDGTFGTISTITVHPSLADVTISGGVQSDNATLSGSVERAITLSGAVQSGVPTLTGNLNKGGTTNVFGGVQADDSTVSGSVERAVESFGGVQSQNATVSGGINKVMEFSGALFSQSSTVSGSIISGDVIPSPNTGAKKPRKIRTGKVKRKITTRQIKR